VSRGFNAWLRSHNTSLAFTSCQTGQLFLVGAHSNGTVSFNQQNFSHAMGLCWKLGRLYLGSQFQLWRLENMLKPGDVDIHEVGVDADGRVIFVNTKYSALCTLDLTHSFKPVWKPDFISKLAPEDRCHLNGLAMDKGQPRYVTAVSRSDILSGWRRTWDRCG